jgi:GntR family transcriptional regulator/MocR family aminotransferase
MAKGATGALLGLVTLDRDADAPLFRQLDRQLRDAILSGQLAPGTRLPSSRLLARELGVSRISVTAAFDQLIAEGYLEGHRGAGTFVTSELPMDLAGIAGLEPAAPADAAPVCDVCDDLSTRGHLLRSTRAGTRPETPAAFTPSVPAFEEFPFRIWSRLTARHVRNPDPALLRYGDPAGWRPLREAVATYLRDARGVRCGADQVIIVSGAQQAFELAGWMLLDPGDPVWVEDPGYVAGRDALRAAGAAIHGIPLDAAGVDIEAGSARCPLPRMLMVTPSRQHPLGVTMTLRRRLELLRWAQDNRVWVLEDDYDSEFRYRDRPVAAMQGLDRQGRVIYTGTFSKVLFPALRLGYMVVPRDLVDAFCAARTLAGRTVPSLAEAVLADFITEGHFSAHIRRMRQIYAERQQALLEAARDQLAGRLELQPAAAGMHLIGWLPAGTDERRVVAAAERRGVVVVPLSHYSIAPGERPGILLGFTATPVAVMPDAVARLAQALTEAA